MSPKAAVAALLLGLSSCGGTAFTAAALGSDDAGDTGIPADSALEAWVGAPMRDSAPAGDASSGGGEAESPPDGGAHEASTVEAGDSSTPGTEASAEAMPPLDAPDTDGGAEAGDGWVCTLLPPDAAPFGCFGALTRPANYALRVVNAGHPDGGCAEQTTPLACQCAETYTCACIAQTPGLACAGSGVWQGCIMQDGVPVVTCSN